MLSVPFLALKGVSDYVFHDSEDLSNEFAANLGPVSMEVAEVLHNCLNYLLGKPLYLL